MEKRGTREMMLVVGLGNPGEKYAETRHNVGFMVVEMLAEHYKVSLSEKSQFEGEFVKHAELVLLKPTTFMNESGRSVRKIVDYFGVLTENIWVAHDDLDILWGGYKLVYGKGPKVHNGLNSVIEHLDTAGFGRVRIGVDSRKDDERKIPGREYVLKKFSQEEKLSMRRVVADVCDDLLARVNS